MRLQLECRKINAGLRDGGLSKKEDIWGEKIFPQFPSEKGQKGRNRAEIKGVPRTGGSFRGGVRVSADVRGERVWGQIQVGGGGGFSLEMREEGKGVDSKGTGKSMRTHLSQLPFSKLPFSFSLQKVRRRPISADIQQGRADTSWAPMC